MPAQVEHGNCDSDFALGNSAKSYVYRKQVDRDTGEEVTGSESGSICWEQIVKGFKCYAV